MLNTSSHESTARTILVAVAVALLALARVGSAQSITTNSPVEIRQRAVSAAVEAITFPSLPCPHIPCPVSYPTALEANEARRVARSEMGLVPPFAFGIVGHIAGAGDYVWLVVSPGSKLDDDVITGAVIRVLDGSLTILNATPNTAQRVREGRTIQPLRTIIKPVVLQNAFGARWESAEGTFVFEAATLAPDHAITIVMTRGRQEWEWTMPPSELAQLKLK
jgi:hypothetical protein